MRELNVHNGDNKAIELNERGALTREFHIQYEMLNSS